MAVSRQLLEIKGEGLFLGQVELTRESGLFLACSNSISLSNFYPLLFFPSLKLSVPGQPF